MRILFFGDIVGRQAREYVIDETSTIKDNFACDFVITNCENSAGGFGVHLIFVKRYLMPEVTFLPAVIIFGISRRFLAILQSSHDYYDR